MGGVGLRAATFGSVRFARYGHFGTAFAVLAFALWMVPTGWQLANDPNAELAQLIGVGLVVIGIPLAALAVTLMVSAWRLPEATPLSFFGLVGFDLLAFAFCLWRFVDGVRQWAGGSPPEGGLFGAAIVILVVNWFGLLAASLLGIRPRLKWVAR